MPVRERQRRYERTPRGAFVRQRQKAHSRGIPWELTFDQWWQIWEDSGLWKCRGNWVGGAVMMRNGDTGPYAVGNVRIGSFVENVQERNRLVAIRRRHSARTTTVWFE